MELFLLDNLMMNYLMLRIGSVLTGSRAHSWRMLAAALFGSVCALLSVTRAPWMKLLLPKLLLGFLMALPLTDTLRGYWKAVLCLYLSACLMGGVMFGLLMLFGGAFQSGAYIGTVPVRILLAAATVGAVLPRCIVSFMQAIRQRSLRVRVRMRFADRTLSFTALSDSGNLLIEPISGLPVMVVRPGLLPKTKKARPVAYHSVGTSGMLYAVRPLETWIYVHSWRSVALMAAESDTVFQAADAIIPASLLTEERRYEDIGMETDGGTAVSQTDHTVGESAPLHPLGGDASCAVSAAGGADVDRQTHAE